MMLAEQQTMTMTTPMVPLQPLVLAPSFVLDSLSLRTTNTNNHTVVKIHLFE
jgi:hypothetical protein